MRPQLRDQLPKIIEICKQHHVRRAALFGSALDESFDPARSDVDLLIDFEELTAVEHADAYFALIEALETALGRHVDLVERRAIRNPYFRSTVEQNHLVLYDAA